MKKVLKAHGDKVILDDVTMSFLPGAKIGVVGPNGAGKSTILKIMAGLDHANNGDAILGGAAQELVGVLQLELELAAGEIRVDKETDGHERKLLQKAKRA